MTRDEIRRAFRQAQQEQFAAVPQQPKIDVSPKFQRKMERLLQRAPRRRISKKQRIGQEERALNAAFRGY